MTKMHYLAASHTAHRRPWFARLVGLLLGLLMLGTGHAAEKDPSNATRVWMTVGDRRFAVSLAATEAARAFAARLPLSLQMTDLHDNEKKFDLPDALPANPARPGTIRNGDLMLWGANTVVLFYKTFDSTYSYTRLGRVDDPTGLAQAVGRGSVQIRFAAQD